MEALGLIDPAFWASRRPHVAGGGVTPPDLGELEGHVLFQTSGSTGEPKWVALSREALLLSAAVVNRHLEVDERSVWGLALPLKHVGGFGVAVRAFEAAARLAVFPNRWDTRSFAAWLAAEKVTHSSLVPTQVHDLVTAEIRAPNSLRAVVVGGGRLDPVTGAAARRLGWPVLASYGMTESASQIATQALRQLEEPFTCEGLPVLPHWEIRTDGDGRISINGGALFSGWLAGDGFSPRPAGWFGTSDRGSVSDGRLTVLGRFDRVVKILGELVDPDEVAAKLGMPDVTIVTLPDERRGQRLVAVCDSGASFARLEGQLAALNARLPGHQRIDRVVRVESIPRSEMGKVRHSVLSALLRKLGI